MGITLDMVVKKNLHCVKMPRVGDNEIVFCYQFCHYRFWFDKMVFSIRSISYNDVLHSQLMYFPIIFINTQKIIMTNFLFDLIDYPSYSFIYIPYQYSDHQSLECHLISISTGTIYSTNNWFHSCFYFNQKWCIIIAPNYLSINSISMSILTWWSILFSWKA